MKVKKIGAITIICAGLLLVGGCGKVAKLANGSDAIVSLKDNNSISVDDLYNELKNNYALEELITMVDTKILEKEFPDYIEKSQSYAKSYIDSMISQYGDENKLLQALQAYTSYSTVEAYQTYIYLSYLQSHATEEYAKTQITDKQIQKYYKEQSVGDIEVSHILITPDVKDGATDDEKKTAETNAKNQASEIINNLKEAKNNKEDVATKFSELAKEYSKDDSTKDKGGSLGKINKTTLGDSYDELVAAAYKLNDGEFSEDLITTEQGYEIVFKSKSYEKDTLENLKESITKTLAEKLMTEDTLVSINALEYYRSSYDMNIEDSELKKQYDNYLKNVKSQATASKETN